MSAYVSDDLVAWKGVNFVDEGVFGSGVLIDAETTDGKAHVCRANGEIILVPVTAITLIYGVTL